MKAEPRQSGATPRRRPGPGRLACVALCAIAASLALAATPGLGFSRSVTPGLIHRYAARFGPDAGNYIGGWQQFVRSAALEQAQHQGNELELLRAVNTFFNKTPSATDLAHWGVDDYWASPAEFIASYGGDCEDFSIAKYFALKELGVPIDRLRITYVKAARINQAHMVLAYFSAPGAVPFVMDNLENEVKPASERTDLIPVFSFNDDDLLLLRPGRNGSSAGSTLQIRQWRGLIRKLERELAY